MQAPCDLNNPRGIQALHPDVVEGTFRSCSLHLHALLVFSSVEKKLQFLLAKGLNEQLESVRKVNSTYINICLNFCICLWRWSSPRPITCPCFPCCIAISFTTTSTQAVDQPMSKPNNILYSQRKGGLGNNKFASRGIIGSKDKIQQKSRETNYCKTHHGVSSVPSFMMMSKHYSQQVPRNPGILAG
jgi:hypothetical protein